MSHSHSLHVVVCGLHFIKATLFFVLCGKWKPVTVGGQSCQVLASFSHLIIFCLFDSVNTVPERESQLL